MNDQEIIIATYDNQSKNGLVDLEIIEKNVSIKKTVQLEDYVSGLQKYISENDQLKWDNIPLNMVGFGFNNTGYAARFVVDPTDLFLTFQNKPMIWKLPKLLIEVSSSGNLKFWAIKSKRGIKDNFVPGDIKVYDLVLPHHYSGGTVCYGSFARRNVKVDEMVSYAFEYLQTTATHQITKNLVPKEDNYFEYKIFESDFYKKYGELI